MSIKTILLLSLAEVFGDFEFKAYARTNETSHLIGGIVGYIGVMYFLVQALKSANVLYVNGMWDGISAIIESVLALILLRETLRSPIQYMGLGVIVIGIFMLHSGGIPK